MYLYPYDIIRLKQRLGMTSEECLMQHTITAFRENPYFPNVMLKMSDLQDSPCSFLELGSDHGERLVIRDKCPKLSRYLGLK
jgi:hypothetical protein